MKLERPCRADSEAVGSELQQSLLEVYTELSGSQFRREVTCMPSLSWRPGALSRAEPRGGGKMPEMFRASRGWWRSGIVAPRVQDIPSGPQEVASARGLSSSCGISTSLSEIKKRGTDCWGSDSRKVWTLQGKEGLNVFGGLRPVEHFDAGAVLMRVLSTQSHP